MSFICDFICLFFFFKQKTAYEMRISDWSSDVCSSDLTGTTLARVGGFRSEERERLARRDAVNDYCIAPRDCAARSPRGPDHRLQDLNRTVLLAARSLDSRTRKLFAQYRRREGLFCQPRRSEERRVGKEWVSTCRSRGSQYNKKKKKEKKNNESK